MSGIEQGRPEGIGTPENLTTPELLNLVEAQLWIKSEHEREWCYSDYSPEILLDAVGEKVPLSYESQKLLAAQVDNLERTRKKVWEILETGKSEQEILSLAIPEFEDPPEPLEMLPTPYSFHFRLKEDDFNRFLEWVRSQESINESLTKGVAAFGLFSKEYGFSIDLRHEDSLFEVPAPHVVTSDFINTIFPSEIDSERFKEDLDYACQVFEDLVRRDLIIYSALPISDKDAEFWPPFILSFPNFRTARGQISRLYGEQAQDKLDEFTKEVLKAGWVVSQSRSLVPPGRLPILIANLEFGEISKRLPEAAEFYEEERKRREAEEKAFSHLAVSGGLSAVASLGACLGPWMWGAVAVFMSALGNDIRRVIKHDKARQFTFLEELGE